MIPKIMAEPRPYSEDEIKDMATDLVKEFVAKGASYCNAHKILEAHNEVFEEAFKQLGHNALYELAGQPITYKLM